MPHPQSTWKLESLDEFEHERNKEWDFKIQSIREAAEIHKQVRQDAQRYIQPGMDLTQICNYIESTNKRLLGYNKKDPLARCWGFPTGCSINECAAHYTPNPGENLTLKSDDIMKIDFGTQINGHIIDCAFTMTFDSVHDTLMTAVMDATNTGIKTMGIDVRLCDIGAEIQEVMESYQCEYNGEMQSVKCIENLSGHGIAPFKIHSGNTVPVIANNDQLKMSEGEVYAIETFGTSGRVFTEEKGDCSHFMKDWEMPSIPLRHRGAKNLLNFINKQFGTLAFCRRWIQDQYSSSHNMSLKKLCESGIIRKYPPLCDVRNCYVAQYEHTVILRPTCKEIVSRGKDY